MSKNKISGKMIIITGFCFLIVLLLGLFTFKNMKIDNTGEKNKSSSSGSISFEKEKYTCKVGESIITKVKSTIGKTDDGEVILPTVSYYYSLDEKVSTIEISDEEVDCIDCKTFKISCLGKGKTYINAVADNGIKTFTTIEVRDNEPKSSDVE